MLIYIDPGHGGKDPGAVGLHGYRESDVVLLAGRELADALGRVGVGVLLTRTSDVFVELAERARMANAAGADLFISVHANAASVPQAHGFEVWTSRGVTEADRVAFEVIQAVRKRMPDIALRLNVGSHYYDLDKEAGFVVLTHTTMPAILIEIGFITNPDDCTRMHSTPWRQRLMGAVADGVINWRMGSRVLDHET